MKNEKLVLITGATKGLGLATGEHLLKLGYRVIFTGRNEKALSQLKERFSAPQALFERLDTSSPQDIARFCDDLVKKSSGVDILINNAGVFLDAREGGEQSAFKTSLQTLEETLQINTLGPLLLMQKLLPHMLAQNFGRIVNISSGMGQLSEMQGGYLAYRVSKCALNAATKVFAAEARSKNVLINSVCPGWVRTDMGGPSATRSLEEGIAGIVWAATLPEGGPCGGFFRDGKPLSW